MIMSLSKSRFKQGDFVRRNKGTWNGMVAGDKAIIISIGLSGIQLEKYGVGHDHRTLELVSEDYSTVNTQDE